MISSIVALVVCYGALALAAVTPVLTPGKVFTERGVAAQKWQVNFIGVAVIPYNNVDTNQCNLGGGSGSVASYQITVYADNSIQPTIVRAQPTTTYVNQHGFSAGFWKFEISSAGTLTTNWQCCSCVLVGDFFIPPPGSIAQPIKPNTIVGEQICSPNVGANNVDCKSLGVTKPFSQVTVKSGSQSSISPIDG
ncbi:uncharacterized protein L969DRAFT_232214 [Mixia osmundae IAM 14324]|uniref:Uncharacterized protein n=1 Tax=Mixia osmundae (strain CBS 9802 / IAM 14324 / JCM 22182 / KY 12970) TaxID=764103 RepID=G7E2C6_MIXOS|nr:uncharacterized protein L969DRAFT_232214 [Mixia osmundae IAM 14324]KEI36858.1 hypothetical protein L969DRAFT_232214 [Mixia osmundae IAM 14324]GAA96986.1 hypothetical protein E5Q_03660 [Mixia osmundae IAM 14324]